MCLRRLYCGDSFAQIACLEVEGGYAIVAGVSGHYRERHRLQDSHQSYSVGRGEV